MSRRADSEAPAGSRASSTKLPQTRLGDGRPLAPTTRGFFEQRLGHDFRNVRVHDDSAAHAAAAREGARAFAHGSDIAFAAGQLDVSRATGRALLAHELAHVVQQQRGGPTPQRGDAAEAGAARAAAQIDRGGRIAVSGATSVGLARDDTTAAHAGGASGEPNAAFALGKMGFEIVVGPGGPQGHKLTAAGFDIVAFNRTTGEVWIVDNKASGGIGNVRDASAITRNLATNLDTTLNEVKALPDFPGKDLVLSKLQGAKAAVAGGEKLPAGVELVVTNAGGYHKGVGKTLADKGVKFVDVVGEATIAAREKDLAKARAEGVRTGRPVSHEGTRKAGEKVRQQNEEAARSQQAQAAAKARTEPAAKPAPPAATAAPKAAGSAKPAAKSGAQRAINEDFQTSGSVKYTDRYGGTGGPPPATIRSRNAGRAPVYGAALAEFLPRAMNALQDRGIRHRVAVDLLGQWSKVVQWRRENPNEWIVAVVSLQEWEQPDPTGQVARAVNYATFYHGATRADALAQADNVLRAGVPKGWREVGPFLGEIPPTQDLQEVRDKLDEEKCFIATACYGSMLAPQVVLLREFRDVALARCAGGRAFIRFYYRRSPPVARYLARRRTLRAGVRWALLAPIVAAVGASRGAWSVER